MKNRMRTVNAKKPKPTKDSLKKPDTGQMLLNIFSLLFDAYGPQGWWPADTALEVIVGAVLTQNTAWSNVEKALSRLKTNVPLTVEALGTLKQDTLAHLIRPAGFYNQKAQRLLAFLDTLICNYEGKLSRFFEGNPQETRKRLLEIKGFGEETVDSILLYAADLPFFVVDTYTKRVLERHRLIDHKASYTDVQNLFMTHLPHDVALYKEYHALIVCVGKHHCKKNPDCAHCPLSPLLGELTVGSCKFQGGGT